MVVEEESSVVNFDCDFVLALLDRLNVRFMNLSLSSSLCMSKSIKEPSSDCSVELLAFGLDILQIK